MMSIDTLTEIELQAAGLEKQTWTFGEGDRVYKDPENTYLVDRVSGNAWFHYRQNEPLSPLSRRYIGERT